MKKIFNSTPSTTSTPSTFSNSSNQQSPISRKDSSSSSSSSSSASSKTKSFSPSLVMKAVLLHHALKRYGGQRYPKLDPYEFFHRRKELVEWRFIPPQSTIIYVSHEWTGSNHPDHDGTQFYHLLHILERLQRGDISQVDMDAFHSLFYKHNFTTSSS